MKQKEKEEKERQEVKAEARSLFSTFLSKRGSLKAEEHSLCSACLPYKGPAFGLMCYVSPPFRVVGVVRRKLGACLSKVYG